MEIIFPSKQAVERNRDTGSTKNCSWYIVVPSIGRCANHHSKGDFLGKREEKKVIAGVK